MTNVSFELLLNFLNKYQKQLDLPVADFGGSDKIAGKSIRKTLKSGGIVEYYQIDLETGYDLLKPIKGKKFGLGICMDLLEHVTQPFIVAENISNSLKKDALLFVTAPFVWGLHNYPGDYFRYTEEGLKILFPKLKCLETGMGKDMGNVNDIDKFGIRVFAIFKKK
jgi:hypothetical protein